MLQESAASGRAALEQANKDLKRINAELEALQAEQAAAALAANEKIVDLQAQLDVAKSASSSFEAEKATLGHENHELKARVNELEVDILEAKEASEKAVDESATAFAALKQGHWEEKDALTKGLQEELHVAVEKHEAAAKLWEQQSLEAAKAHESDKAAALAEAQTQANTASKTALDSLAAEHSANTAALEAKHVAAVEDIKRSHEEAQASSRVVIKGLSDELQVWTNTLRVNLRTQFVSHRSNKENTMPRSERLKLSTRPVSRRHSKKQRFVLLMGSIHALTYSWNYSVRGGRCTCSRNRRFPSTNPFDCRSGSRCPRQSNCGS